MGLTQTEEELLIQLKSIRRSPKDCGGICVMLWGGAIKKAFKTTAKGWEHHSGDYEFPVPAPEGECPKEFYYEAYAGMEWSGEVTRNFWAGEYGEKRTALLEWMIEELEGKLG